MVEGADVEAEVHVTYWKDRKRPVEHRGVHVRDERDAVLGAELQVEQVHVHVELFGLGKGLVVHERPNALGETRGHVAVGNEEPLVAQVVDGDTTGHGRQGIRAIACDDEVVAIDGGGPVIGRDGAVHVHADCHIDAVLLQRLTQLAVLHAQER